MGILDGLFNQQTQPGPLYGGQPTQQPQMALGNALRPFLVGMGMDIAANRSGAGAPAMAASMAGNQRRRQLAQQQQQEMAQRNQTLDYLKTTPGLEKYYEAAAAGVITPSKAYEMSMKPQEAKQRRIVSGADGFKYYEDDNSRVLPDVKKQQVNGIQIVDGQLVYNPPKKETDNIANSIDDARSAAAEANKFKTTISGMRSALDSAGYMGPGAEKLGVVDDFLESTGLPSLPGNSTSRAMVQAGGMDFVLSRIQQTKGAISEKEMDAFKAASPGLTKTKAGNKLLLDIAEKTADRQIERVNMMEKWRAQNGGRMDGFEEAWTQYVNANPIITEDMFNGGEAKPPQAKDHGMPDFSTMSDDELRKLANGQ